MELPTISNYGNYSSSNYGAHCLVVSMLNVDVYFSYKTPVAFRAPEIGMVIRENCWGNTTGKHLNWINSDKSVRVSGAEFEKLYAIYVAKTKRKPRKRKRITESPEEVAA